MRHDHAVIKNLHKVYGEQFAKSIQRVPFFYIDEKIENNFADFEHRNEQGFKRQYPEYAVDLMDFEEVERLMPFPLIAVMDHDIGWHLLDHKGNGEWSIGICMDVMLKHLGLPIPPGTLINLSIGYYGMSKNYYDANIQPALLVDSVDSRVKGMTKDWQDRLSSILDNPKFHQEMLGHTTRSLLYFLSFLKWAEGMHMVEVRKKPSADDLRQKAKNYKKPWLRGDLPHYIYLDAPMQGTRPGKEQKHDPDNPAYRVRGHNRRAHWRTLTHARFKNHPQYGRRIRVKATWVGPTDWTVGDTIYTVKGDFHEVSIGRTDESVLADAKKEISGTASQHLNAGQLTWQRSHRANGQAAGN